MLFRFLGSSTKTASQALAPTAIVLLALVLFSGFSLPRRTMLGWCRWINYINPLGWAFESLLINDLAGREFRCTELVPSGPGFDDESLSSRICNVIGAAPGSDVVSGTQHIIEAYNYHPSHRWRNFGILISFMVFFLACTLITSELVAAAKSKGEVLVYPRRSMPKSLKGKREDDVEGKEKRDCVISTATSDTVIEKVPKQSPIFHWRNVCYEVQMKSETRRILDHVSGWIKPGTLTALMVSQMSSTSSRLTSARELAVLVRPRYWTSLPPGSPWVSSQVRCW
jgi:ATP-binding cassette, subfamily G (WHITE), member 2, PDR